MKRYKTKRILGSASEATIWMNRNLAADNITVLSIQSFNAAHTDIVWSEPVPLTHDILSIEGDEYTWQLSPAQLLQRSKIEHDEP